MKKNKNAVELGKLSVRSMSKKDLSDRGVKAGIRSGKLRQEYGYGYWKKPEIMLKIYGKTTRPKIKSSTLPSEIS